MGDRPPPAPWAEELRARTNRHANHSSSGPNAAKAPPVAPKASFGGKSSSATLAQKLTHNLNQGTAPVHVAAKPSPPPASSSFPPPPAAPPAAPPAPSPAAPPAPSSYHIKTPPFASQVNANQSPPAAVPPPQPKTMTSPSSPYNQPMKSPPSSMVGCCLSAAHADIFFHTVYIVYKHRKLK